MPGTYKGTPRPPAALHSLALSTTNPSAIDFCHYCPCVLQSQANKQHTSHLQPCLLSTVPSSSRPAALNATPSRLAVPTRSAPTLTASSAASLAKPPATPTPPPTRTLASPGPRPPWPITSRTPRSTFLAPRWPLLVSRRCRIVRTSLPTSRRRAKSQSLALIITSTPPPSDHSSFLPPLSSCFRIPFYLPTCD